ncbi:hypothetical protein Ciccas_010429 [Cichlidogyrus casuarinus]|uniref:Uncharacterized protein n=1 Tax=Cichlidogyrus casuarinus TaxID=1844966 RepID=A0ABD2PU52_9PLAT
MKERGHKLAYEELKLEVPEAGSTPEAPDTLLNIIHAVIRQLTQSSEQSTSTEDKPDGPDSVLDSPANAQALDECRESEGAALAFYHSPIHWDALWHPYHQKSALPAFPICCLGSLSGQPLHQRQLVGTQLPHDLGRPHIGFYSRLNVLDALY